MYPIEQAASDTGEFFAYLTIAVLCICFLITIILVSKDWIKNSIGTKLWDEIVFISAWAFLIGVALFGLMLIISTPLP